MVEEQWQERQMVDFAPSQPEQETDLILSLI